VNFLFFLNWFFFDEWLRHETSAKSNIKNYDDDSPPHISYDDPELTTPRHRLHHYYALLSWLHFYYYLLYYNYYLPHCNTQMIGWGTFYASH
jgi:hypothetical protein